MKEQIGSSFYYPPTYYRSSGRFIIPIQVKDSLENYYPLRKAEAEFNVLQGYWYNNRTRYCILASISTTGFPSFIWSQVPRTHTKLTCFKFDWVGMSMNTLIIWDHSFTHRTPPENSGNEPFFFWPYWEAQGIPFSLCISCNGRNQKSRSNNQE